MPAPFRPTSSVRIHHAGDWPAERVRTTWVPSSRVVPPEAARLIDDVWARATIEPNRKLFDGPMCRIESWRVDDDGVAAALSRTSYKAFWGTNIMHPELADRFGPAVMANPVGVSPALESVDGYLLMGRRNAEVAYYPGRVHPFSGALEPGDGPAADGGPGPDLFADVARELLEELRLGPADLDLIRLTGVVEDVRLRQPELVFRAKTRLTRAQVDSQIEKAEHTAGVAVPATPAGVEAALMDAALTPVAVASLLLWGRTAFGETWYADACRAVGVMRAG